MGKSPGLVLDHGGMQLLSPWHWMVPLYPRPFQYPQQTLPVPGQSLLSSHFRVALPVGHCVPCTTQMGAACTMVWSTQHWLVVVSHGVLPQQTVFGSGVHAPLLELELLLEEELDELLEELLEVLDDDVELLE